MHPTCLPDQRFGRVAKGTLAVTLATVCQLTYPALASPNLWDNQSDTWTATDALGRRLPDHHQTGPPRPDRWVGIFYFLWLGAHVNGGPYDISKILAQAPDAMQQPNHPLWGPLHAPHHWGESLFGYYLTDDAYVLRKHAQMLADAGVDTLIFDVTNQFTYRDYYRQLLSVFSAVRAQGGRTPHVAFLCPFWDPRKVVLELYRDLYEPGLHSDLWFRWDNKPLILADPSLLRQFIGTEHQDSPVPLEPAMSLGQSFSAADSFLAVSARLPTWHTTNAAATLTLRTNSPQGAIVATRRARAIPDNAWVELPLSSPAPPGRYYLELSSGHGQVGWWSHSQDVFAQGHAWRNGQATSGDRTLRLHRLDAQHRAILDFFTFRKPQPDYFAGPTQPDMWSWLEVYPQHVFPNARDEKEQMSVGVAQNAVGQRLATLSEPGARGRSYANGRWHSGPEAVLHGYNLAEQFEYALAQDPRFVFITGWNEWIAGRFKEFNGVKMPVMFVDQFNHENSRDIEPMKGGHGDNYYYQMIAYIRRFKGVRPPPPPATPRTISLEQLSVWGEVQPEYRDDRGDVVHRDHFGYNRCARYTNDSGRNDFVCTKVAFDREQVYFYARTAQPLSSATDPNWMLLLIDVDARHETGWEGYDVRVNHTRKGSRTSLETRTANGDWRTVEEVSYHAFNDELCVAVPRRLFGTAEPFTFEFKWSDNVPDSGQILEFVTHGDAAPNGRFNYRFTGTERRPPPN